MGLRKESMWESFFFFFFCSNSEYLQTIRNISSPSSLDCVTLCIFFHQFPKYKILGSWLQWLFSTPFISLSKHTKVLPVHKSGNLSYVIWYISDSIEEKGKIYNSLAIFSVIVVAECYLVMCYCIMPHSQLIFLLRLCFFCDA